MVGDESDLIHIEKQLPMNRNGEEAVEKILQEIQKLDSTQKARLLSRAIGVDCGSISIGSNNVDADVVYQFNNIGPESMASVLDAVSTKISGMLSEEE